MGGHPQPWRFCNFAEQEWYYNVSILMLNTCGQFAGPRTISQLLLVKKGHREKVITRQPLAPPKQRIYWSHVPENRYADSSYLKNWMGILWSLGLNSCVRLNRRYYKVWNLPPWISTRSLTLLFSPGPLKSLNDPLKRKSKQKTALFQHAQKTQIYGELFLFDIKFQSTKYIVNTNLKNLCAHVIFDMIDLKTTYIFSY